MLLLLVFRFLAFVFRPTFVIGEGSGGGGGSCNNGRSGACVIVRRDGRCILDGDKGTVLVLAFVEEARVMNRFDLTLVDSVSLERV